MKKVIYFGLLLVFLPFPVFGDELKPFTTDACSAFPEGTLTQQSLWSACCIKHDIAYWQGGTYQERLETDQVLKQCVAKVGEPEIAKLMLAGVSVGGSPYFPTSYRWGYGWPYPRGYKAPTAEEKEQVREELARFEILIKSILEELN